MAALELKVPPVGLFLIAAISMWATARYMASAQIPAGLSWPLGGSLLVAGITTGIAGVLAFRRHQTTVHPMQPEKATVIVTDGVYRVTRNPMYLGLTLVLGAWGLFLGAWPALFFIPGFMLYMTRFQIIPEERALRAGFGDDYDRYRASVRRWL